MPYMLQSIQQEILEIEMAVGDAKNAVGNNIDDNINPFISYWTLQIGSILLVI